MRYFCESEARRAALERHPTLNGIDFLEVRDLEESDPEKRQRFLYVRFLKPLAPDALKPDNVVVTGGERIINPAVRTVQVDGTDAHVLIVEVATAGDFSRYRLSLVTAQGDAEDITQRFDPMLLAVDFSFKVERENTFDCKVEEICPSPTPAQPLINYLARDYNSFRQLLLDRLALLVPDWKERNPADVGIMLVELLAYVGDYLSYQQDAMASEQYLSTCRLRTSARRHARLIDYFMHDGCNARAWVQIEVSTKVTVEAKTWLLTGLPNLPRRLNALPDLSQVAPSAAGQPSGVAVFETMHSATLYPEHNQLAFYTWGAEGCCLPQGATKASLCGNLRNLHAGDILILKETLGPHTGRREDANPAHRHAVRLRRVTYRTDPLATELSDERWPDWPHITEIEWVAEDALPFPLCISATTDEDHGVRELPAVSVALGNIVLADHGQTINDDDTQAADRESFVYDGQSGRPLLPRLQPRLKQTPVTQRVVYKPPTAPPYPSATAALRQSLQDTLPAVYLRTIIDANAPRWEPQRDLLNSDGSDEDFVVEIESDQVAYLRFGDDVHGKRPPSTPSPTTFYPTYRIGNGTAGNIGAEAIQHIVYTDPAVLSATNPLPARGGVEPETIQEVRQWASSALRRQERAVTAQDYADFAAQLTSAEGLQEVQRTVATFRWTGSWHTVYVTADRVGGRRVEADDFETRMRRHLERYRMAGHDLEVDNPLPIALEVAMTVRVQPEYFTSDVEKALRAIFSNRILPDGRRGLFHPDNFTFGQTIYLSPFQAEAQAVAGVVSVEITKFQRQGIDSREALDTGKLVLGRLEIARLENDPNYPERGGFSLKMEGGR